MSMLIDFFEKLRISVLSTTWPSKLCRVSLTRPLVLGRLSYTNGRLKLYRWPSKLYQWPSKLHQWPSELYQWPSELYQWPCMLD